MVTSLMRKVQNRAHRESKTVSFAGGVGWLDAFNAEDFGYSPFLATIGTVVMGRATFDQVLTFGTYPYAKQHR